MEYTHLSDLLEISPLIAVTFTAFLVLGVEAIRPKSSSLSSIVSVIGMVVALILVVLDFGSAKVVFGGTFHHGVYGSFFSGLFLVAGILTVLLSRTYLEAQHSHRTEYYALTLFSIVGMMLMASSLDLILIFLGLELMSLCLYVLAGFRRTEPASNEASLKYFLLGAFATGFLLYGIALVYGTTGTTNLRVIGESFQQYSDNIIFIIGAALLLISFSFKVAAVPFHMWVPDVYEGAPTNITAFMSTGAKAAGFAAFVTVFMRTFVIAGSNFSDVVAVIAAISMIVGNVTAVAQSSVKRMLAYSSIAHAGYMLAAIAAGNPAGQSGILFYLAAYVVMNIGAFGIVLIVEGKDASRVTFDHYAGLSARRPYLAALMALFMFSLAGIPPLAGFFGKYYVFLAAVEGGLTWLAVVGVLTSLVSVYYYTRLVVVMYFRDGEGDVEEMPDKAAIVSISIAALAVLELGIYPGSIVQFAQQIF